MKRQPPFVNPGQALEIMICFGVKKFYFPFYKQRDKFEAFFLSKKWNRPTTKLLNGSSSTKIRQFPQLSHPQKALCVCCLQTMGDLRFPLHHLRDTRMQFPKLSDSYDLVFTCIKRPMLSSYSL